MFYTHPWRHMRLFAPSLFPVRSQPRGRCSRARDLAHLAWPSDLAMAYPTPTSALSLSLLGAAVLLVHQPRL